MSSAVVVGQRLQSHGGLAPGWASPSQGGRVGRFQILLLTCRGSQAEKGLGGD